MKKILVLLFFISILAPVAASAATSCIFDPNICTGNTYCATDGTCQSLGGGAPPPPGTQPAGPPAAPPAGPTGSSGFVPLEPNSPLYQAEQAGSIPQLLATLYNICVGIAVVLAVIQLTRAGITYMLSDSITNKEQARHLIMTSVLGLLLVLSPVIVFSLINPDILKFNLNLDSLQVAPEGQNPVGPGSQSGSNGTGSVGGQGTGGGGGGTGW